MRDRVRRGMMRRDGGRSLGESGAASCGAIAAGVRRGLVRRDGGRCSAWGELAVLCLCRGRRRRRSRRGMVGVLREHGSRMECSGEVPGRTRTLSPFQQNYNVQFPRDIRSVGS